MAWQIEMSRLVYVDVLRGIAVLWMVFFQLLNMFSVVNIYTDLTWMQRFIGWFGIFIVVVGFSLRLAFEKYEMKDFYKKIFKTGTKLICIGLVLTIICDFQIGFRVIDMEILGAIGFNCMIMCSLFLIDKISKSRQIHALWFGSWCFIMVVLNRLVSLEASFNIIWMQSFMLFGVWLAVVRRYKGIWLIVGISLLAFGLLNVDSVQYPVRTVERWSTYCGVICLLMLSFSRIRIKSLNRFFSYFGKHALFFYIFHYAIFQRPLIETGLIRTFSALGGLILTFMAIGILVMIEKTYCYLPIPISVSRILNIKQKKKNV